MHMPTLILNAALLEHSELSVLNESRNFWLYDRMGFLMLLSAEKLWVLKRKGWQQGNFPKKKTCLFGVHGQTGLALRYCQLWGWSTGEWKGRTLFVVVSFLCSQEENMSCCMVPDCDFWWDAHHGFCPVTFWINLLGWFFSFLFFFFVWPTSVLLISKCQKSQSPISLAYDVGKCLANKKINLLVSQFE